MRRCLVSVSLAAAAMFVFACTPPVSARGPADGGSRAPDGGWHDAGVSDGGGSTDAGISDAGGGDAGVPDGSVGDAGSPDAGGCSTSADCDSSQYCAATGCDGQGSCQARPQTCPGYVMPVCGCDGITYGNSCDADEAGVRVANDGACSSPGGSCESNAECVSSQYCAGEGCHSVGYCQTIPQQCSGNLAPVCGCDGNTYGNACEAAKASERIASNGACSSPQTNCLTNADCTASEYCAGAGCDVEGTCEARPQVCSSNVAPVCGCDGTTYDNACDAAEAGVRVASNGACPSPGGTCASNTDCEATQYCAGNGCGGQGYCQTKPQTCPLYVMPVCGCDGTTYGNPCDAAEAGVRVASDGPCPAPDGGTPDGGSGCLTNAECDLYQYCAGQGCDTPGSCQAKPQGCPLIVAPVCGCDGNTYGNECEAFRAGVRVASNGPCSTPDGGTVDGGTSDGGVPDGGGVVSCASAGGQCVAVVPGSCPWPSTICGPSQCSCGGGLGVECCLPGPAASACQQAGGQCVPKFDGCRPPSTVSSDSCDATQLICCLPPANQETCQQAGGTCESYYQCRWPSTVSNQYSCSGGYEVCCLPSANAQSCQAAGGTCVPPGNCQPPSTVSNQYTCAGPGAIPISEVCCLPPSP